MESVLIWQLAGDKSVKIKNLLPYTYKEIHINLHSQNLIDLKLKFLYCSCCLGNFVLILEYKHNVTS